MQTQRDAKRQRGAAAIGIEETSAQFTQRTYQDRYRRDCIAMALVYRVLVATNERRGSSLCDLYATEHRFRSSESFEDVVANWRKRLEQVSDVEPLHLEWENRMDLDWSRTVLLERQTDWSPEHAKLQLSKMTIDVAELGNLPWLLREIATMQCEKIKAADQPRPPLEPTLLRSTVCVARYSTP